MSEGEEQEGEAVGGDTDCFSAACSAVSEESSGSGSATGETASPSEVVVPADRICWSGTAARDSPAALETAESAGGRAEVEVAAEEGFALCYPQGEANSVGKTGWNVGYPSQADLKSDDIAYIRFLAKALVKKHGFSARNVFLSGMSNGGEMCYLQAYSGDRTFAAIASVAGLTMKWIYDTRKPLRPVPFLELHGTADKTSLWEGDPAGEHGWGGYIAVPAAVAAMIAADGCTAYSREEPAFPRSDRVTLHRFSEGRPAWKGGPPCEVLLYQIDGGTHSWSLQDLDTCREIWRFFKKWMR